MKYGMPTAPIFGLAVAFPQPLLPKTLALVREVELRRYSRS